MGIGFCLVGGADNLEQFEFSPKAVPFGAVQVDAAGQGRGV